MGGGDMSLDAKPSRRDSQERTSTPAWRALEAHCAALNGKRIRDLFADDDRRFHRFSLSTNGLLLDYSKNLVTGETLELLLELARERGMEEWFERMFRGDAINHTEGRPA